MVDWSVFVKVAAFKHTIDDKWWNGSRPEAELVLKMLARSTTLDYGHIQNVQALHTTHSVTITIRGVFYF